jgi:phosphate transport system permease protein
MIMLIVVPVGRRALITGLILATARALGETAPLIFTAFGNRFLEYDPSHPMSAIPLTIWRYATGPYDEWHQQAWAASFLLLVVVFLVSFATRYFFRGRYDE